MTPWLIVCVPVGLFATALVLTAVVVGGGAEREIEGKRNELTDYIGSCREEIAPKSGAFLFTTQEIYVILSES